MHIANEDNEAAEQNFFDMPDDDVMGMTSPAPVMEADPVEPKKPADEVATEVVTDPPAASEEEGGEASPGSAEGEGEADLADPPETAKAKAVQEGAAKKEPAQGAASVVDPAGKATESGTSKKDPPAENQVVAPKAYGEWSPEEKAAALDQLMTFKANGREVKLETPEEALKLQQMGANYTKKMQALQPVLRVVKMLENNKLMDEAQLSYLIDLHQKKPEAIQKLLADSAFDPLTADVEKAAEYVPGDHRVSENEIQFETILEEVESSPTGPELIAEVAQQWDADSRQALFKDPRLLIAINDQKANGLYGRIAGEIERRRVLGDLRGVPFLQAYEAVGKDLQAKGLLVPEAAVPRQEAPVTRVVVPAPAVANSERAKAAMPTKAVTTPSKQDFSPFEVPDDEFMKKMEGRV